MLSQLNERTWRLRDLDALLQWFSRDILCNSQWNEHFSWTPHYHGNLHRHRLYNIRRGGQSRSELSRRLRYLDYYPNSD